MVVPPFLACRATDGLRMIVPRPSSPPATTTPSGTQKGAVLSQNTYKLFVPTDICHQKHHSDVTLCTPVAACFVNPRFLFCAAFTPSPGKSLAPRVQFIPLCGLCDAASDQAVARSVGRPLIQVCRWGWTFVGLITRNRRRYFCVYIFKSFGMGRC